DPVPDDRIITDDAPRLVVQDNLLVGVAIEHCSRAVGADREIVSLHDADGDGLVDLPVGAASYDAPVDAVQHEEAALAVEGEAHRRHGIALFGPIMTELIRAAPPARGEDGAAVRLAGAGGAARGASARRGRVRGGRTGFPARRRGGRSSARRGAAALR